LKRLLITTILALVACGEEPPDTGDTDTNTTDSTTETGPTDTSPTDTSPTDSGITEPPPVLHSVGEQRTLLILVHTPGVAPSCTDEEATQLMDSVAAWVYAASAGVAWITYDQTPWLEVSDTSEMVGESFLAARDAGFVLEDYTRYIVADASPHSAGKSTLGFKTLEFEDEDGEVVVLEGSRIGIGEINPSYDALVLHELGHSLGLLHAAVASGLDGEIYQYGDGQDVMGMSVAKGEFSVAGQYLIGWLPESDIFDAEPGGSYYLENIESENTTALRIPVPDDDTGERFYWVGARDHGDNDSGGTISVVLSEEESSTYGHLTLDATPESVTYKLYGDADLKPGRSFTTPDGLIHFTAVSADTDGVNVQVEIDDGSTNQLPVITDISSTPVQGSPESTELSITASDPDGDDLSIFWAWGLQNDEQYSVGVFGDGESWIYEDPTGQATQALVRVWVSDRRGGVVTSSVGANGYQNSAPNIIGAVATAGPVINKVAFEVNVSDDNALTYLWDFGDGSTSTYRQPNHTYGADGYYQYTVNVSDGEFTDIYTETILSLAPGAGELPVAVAGPDQTVSPGAVVTLDGSGSYDLDGDSFTNGWQSVDGLTIDDARAMITTVTMPAQPGVYEMIFRVLVNHYDHADSTFVTVE